MFYKVLGITTRAAAEQVQWPEPESPSTETEPERNRNGTETEKKARNLTEPERNYSPVPYALRLCFFADVSLIEKCCN
jgi:hypothetical protein